MARIQPLILELGVVIRNAIETEGVTREDAVAAWAQALTRLDQKGVWHRD